VKLPRFSNSFQHFLPSYTEMDYAESQFGFHKVLSFIPFDDFLFIFISLLHEKSIIIVSEKTSLTTGLITTLRCLMMPFEWCFPSIYNVSEDCFCMLNSPVPLIAGV